MKQIITSLITLAILSSALILPAPTKASDASDEADKRLQSTIQSIYKPIILRTLPNESIPMACDAVEALLISSPMNNTRSVAKYKEYVAEVGVGVATLSYKCDRGKDYNENIKRYARIHTDAMQRYMVASGNDQKTSKDFCDLSYTMIVGMSSKIVQGLQENKL